MHGIGEYFRPQNYKSHPRRQINQEHFKNQKQLEQLAQELQLAIINGGESDRWYQQPNAKIDRLLKLCVFCGVSKHENEKQLVHLQMEARSMHFHPIRMEGLNLHSQDMVCYNCMDALDTFSKTVIPLRNDLLAAVGPHPSGFEDAMRFSEQGLVNLEAAEHRHNMHIHAVEQEDFDELENVEEGRRGTYL